MAIWKKIFFVGLLVPAVAYADVGKIVEPLPCGIYDQQARPFTEKDLETQSKDRSRYTMEITTAGGKRLTVEVQNFATRLQGERQNISVFLDGKPLAKTGHQDLPAYLEVHVDGVKYRVICLRIDFVPLTDPKDLPMIFK